MTHHLRPMRVKENGTFVHHPSFFVSPEPRVSLFLSLHFYLFSLLKTFFRLSS